MMEALGGRTQKILCGKVDQIDTRYGDGIRRERPLYVGDDFLVGRDKEDCHIVFEDITISNYHLRIYVIDFDDCSSGIAPLVYVQDISRNGTKLVPASDPADDSFDCSEKTLKKHHPAYLISHGDQLHLSCFDILEFRLVSFEKLGCSTRELVRRPEKAAFKDLYKITRRKIGEGGFAAVYLAFDQEKRSQVACKVIDVKALSQEAEERRSDLSRMRGAEHNPYQTIKQEVEILFDLSHPNILVLESVFCSSNTAYIFTELVPAGDLLSYIRLRHEQMDDISVLVIVHQILQAVQYLQDKNIVHRDLKPENVLMTSLDDGARLIVSDFGHARYLPGTGHSRAAIATHNKLKRMFSLVGTLEYTAPEMYTTEGINNGYSNAIDIWSVGTITALLLSGTHPFSLENESELPEYEREKLYRQNARNRNLNALNTSESWRRARQCAKDFVMTLLVVNEDERPTAAEALKHDWFALHQPDLDDVYNRATRNWHPQRRGRKILVDLDSKQSDQRKQKLQGQQKPHTSVSESSDEDQLTQDHQLMVGKSRFFARS